MRSFRFSEMGFVEDVVVIVTWGQALVVESLILHVKFLHNGAGC